MRIIGREQQQLVRAHLLEHELELARMRRLVDRLQGEADMLAHDFGGRAIHPRNLAPYAAPGLLEAPKTSRQPSKARFDEHGFKARKFDEDALGNKAQKRALEGARIAHVVF